MSDKKTPDDYEVGYGKPPEATQFQKGISGNPKGRPKKIVDFDTELIREANSLITVNDNGKRKSISKFQGIAKQLINKALTGNMSALRMFLTICQPALERAALSATQRSKSLEEYDDVRKIPEEELERFIWEAIERERERSGTLKSTSNKYGIIFCAGILQRLTPRLLNAGIRR